MTVIVYLDLGGGVNGAITGTVDGDTSHVCDGLLCGVIANDVLGACAGDYARGQLEGCFGLDGPSYVIFKLGCSNLFFISRN